MSLISRLCFSREQVVERHYRMMRENQTMEYVKRMHTKFCW
jgi:hypothetical protein